MDYDVLSQALIHFHKLILVPFIETQCLLIAEGTHKSKKKKYEMSCKLLYKIIE